MLLGILQNSVNWNTHHSQNKDMPNSYILASPQKLPGKKPTSARHDLGLYSVASYPPVVDKDYLDNSLICPVCQQVKTVGWFPHQIKKLSPSSCIAPSYTPTANTTENGAPITTTSTLLLTVSPDHPQSPRRSSPVLTTTWREGYISPILQIEKIENKKQGPER